MKRDFNEITDEEWGRVPHSFQPSRVLKPPPPPIESFAYTELPNTSLASTSSRNRKAGGRSVESLELEDDDVELEDLAPLPPANRGRRFIVDDDEDEDGGQGEDDKMESDDDLVEVLVIKSSDDEEQEVENEYEDLEREEVDEEDVDELDEEDVVGKALQKCAKISSELKKSLYGSSFTSCDHYSAVEASSNRIITQVHFKFNCILKCYLEIHLLFFR